jgi:hypothetical protein
VADDVGPLMMAVGSDQGFILATHASGKSPHMIGHQKFQDRRAEITIPKDATLPTKSLFRRAKSPDF